MAECVAYVDQLLDPLLPAKKQQYIDTLLDSHVPSASSSTSIGIPISQYTPLANLFTVSQYASTQNADNLDDGDDRVTGYTTDFLPNKYISSSLLDCFHLLSSK